MKNILIIGAGKSSSYLIKYLLEKSNEEKLQLTVGDISKENANKLINNHKNAKSVILDIFNIEQRRYFIQKADIIIARRPASGQRDMSKDSCIAPAGFGYTGRH